MTTTSKYMPTNYERAYHLAKTDSREIYLQGDKCLYSR
jgi:hypothetical protein